MHHGLRTLSLRLLCALPLMRAEVTLLGWVHFLRCEHLMQSARNDKTGVVTSKQLANRQGVKKTSCSNNASAAGFLFYGPATQ